MTKLKTIELSFHHAENSKEFSNEEQKLITKAQEICKNAYSPYSNFRVGAALLLDDGTIITGSNQENAAYPSGLCAERVAFFYASSEYPDKKVIKVAIAARKDESTAFTPVSPCGSCRQVMLEQEERQENNIEILFQNNGGWVKLSAAEHLLPFCFDKNNLK